LFTRSWVLKGTKNLFKGYSDKKSKYDDDKLKQRVEIQAQKNIEQNLQTRLPINVPEPIYVNKMLEEE
jgi:DNA sulfur modification protein DndD